MNIIFNRIPGKLMDAWYGLYFIYNDNYTELMDKYNVKIEPEIEKAFKYIKKKLKIDYDFMELFFRDCSSTEEIKAIFPPFTDSSFIFQFSTLESYIDFLKNVEEITVKTDFIKKILELKDNDIEMIEALLKDESKLIEQIDTLQISADLKWRALSFIRKPMKDMKEYITLLGNLLEIYKSDSFKKHLKKYDEFCVHIENLNDEERIVFLKRHIGNYWSEDLIKEKNYLTILFLNAVSAFFDRKKDASFMFIGYKLNKLVKQIAGDNEINEKLTMLKNISDSTRFKILMLLKENDLYGQQLADKVGITMPTVSYHMNFLVAGGMVQTFERGHRIYFKLRKEAFKEISEFIQNIFLS